MHTTDRIKVASELVGKALAAGWLSGTGSGETLGKHVASAIDEIVKKINEIDGS